MESSIKDNKSLNQTIVNNSKDVVMNTLEYSVNYPRKT